MAVRNYEPFSSRSYIAVKDEQTDRFGRSTLTERKVTIAGGLMTCSCGKADPICGHMWIALLNETMASFEHGSRSNSVIMSIPCFRYSLAMTPFWMTMIGDGLIEVRTLPIVEYQLVMKNTPFSKLLVMAEPEFVLGYIGRDEGMTAILFQYADYFAAESENLYASRRGEIVCPSKSHHRNNVKLTGILSKHGQPALLGELYNILALGKCSLCHQESLFDDDLNDI